MSEYKEKSGFNERWIKRNEELKRKNRGRQLFRQIWSTCQMLSKKIQGTIS